MKIMSGQRKAARERESLAEAETVRQEMNETIAAS
jgi:hypothetical protein